jgi:hypothetical protein
MERQRASQQFGRQLRQRYRCRHARGLPGTKGGKPPLRFSKGSVAAPTGAGRIGYEWPGSQRELRREHPGQFGT